ncbi:MAG: PaaI family thioesterase [Gammaproteobacteria bacterium]|nr:PaaI family thioesterase [Gammaproteobacteria bacterium]
MSHEPVLPPWSEMTGVEYVQAMIAGTTPHSGMHGVIPMRCVAAAPGYAKFIARADPHHTNPAGPVHGGFAATVLDSVTACAIHTTLAAGVHATTIDLHVKYLRPVPVALELIAEATTTNLSRRLGVADGTLRDATGKLYAQATVTCLILRE